MYIWVIDTGLSVNIGGSQVMDISRVWNTTGDNACMFHENHIFLIVIQTYENVFY